MTTSKQLSFLAPYDASKPAPGFGATIKVGDVLVKRGSDERGVVDTISDNLDGAVFVVRVGDRVAVWLQCEILAHFVRS